jgi:hypothetical protein
LAGMNDLRRLGWWRGWALLHHEGGAGWNQLAGDCREQRTGVCS